MRYSASLALIGMSLVLASPAFGSTIHIISSSQTAITNPSEQITDIEDVTIDTSAGATRLDADSYAYLSRPRPNLDSGNSEVKAYADAATGVLQSRVFQRSFSDFTLEHTSSSNQIILTEQFVVTGSGFLTFNLGLAGGIFGGTGGDKEFVYHYGGSLQIEGGSGILTSDSYNINQSSHCGGNGPTGLCNQFGLGVQESLVASIFVDATVNPSISLTALIASGLLRGQGEMFTMAQLTFKTDRSLTLTPTDSRFLTNIPSVVPLPASLPLVISGIGLLGWLSRRQS